MIEWQFELDSTVIEEPIGFSDIVFNIQRDELWHGIFIEASTSPLGFYGDAYTILKTAKDQYGLNAEVIFTASSRCEGETAYTEAISGKLNFGSWDMTCGNECVIRMTVEQNNCAMVFKNRFDQQVNIDSNVAFDKQTLLEDYTGLGLTIPLATQVIPISADADVLPAGDTVQLTALSFYYNGNLVNHQNLLVRPSYGTITDNSILTGYLDNPANSFQPPGDDFLLTPQVLLEDNPGCIQTEFDYNVRLKGSMVMTVTDVNPINYMSVWACVDYWNGTGTHYGPGQTNGTGNATELHRTLVGTITNPLQGVYTVNFDQSYFGSFTLPVGYGMYAYIKVLHVFDDIVAGNFVTADFDFTFAPETSFLLENVRECPETDCEVYLINETLARATEAITDRCLTIESSYYGRTDSQPYNTSNDGCGSLKVLTPGLKIRQATDKQFFTSMKDIMIGLRAIDNIGMGMESDRVRIEDVAYFYQNIKLLDITLIPSARYQIQEQLVYSNIKTGYNNWEINSIKGIDEFCSYKERRTGIKSVSNELDISTDLIASGYIIENLRTSTLVDSGQTDNKYDNNIFIICVERGGYNYIVEQGVAENATGFFSPATAYNWRIRPLYNVMRWFKLIAQSYSNIVSATNKLFFTSGKGNYLAEGNLASTDNCRLERRAIAENEDIHSTDFDNISDGTPIFYPETITFDYPLSTAEYQTIKAAPYGYVNIQCGANGGVVKTYIKTIEYKPASGMATFTMIKAWL